MTLRAVRPGDADEVAAVLEQHRDPQVQRFTWIPDPYEQLHAEAFLANAERGWRDGDLATFVVDVGGRYRGTVDLRPEPGAWAEIGFGLHPAARGRGVATRAVRRLLTWGFEELRLAGVTWRADVANTASLGVALRCGFTVEGRVRGLLLHRGERVDGVIATLLASDPR
ncbi:Protein N-acetyltransferase, RimJ/RimL family [Quadrisphaera granulorum]|uniref:RimJ/RimL family protein N-acetyltransferase n=1 Tax=Quadrisphaera granulorum TaxID=317664 RepID=A0A316A9B6_9ACTN|nr:RimJ/RimL family protein N-acetyltransferase [Quadrisphaera granulorum]SZE96796.1 Protein N-acetyltransferase, RimJ/RimL family [Quadrisphaera granulorum]